MRGTVCRNNKSCYAMQAHLFLEQRMAFLGRSEARFHDRLGPAHVARPKRRCELVHARRRLRVLACLLNWWPLHVHACWKNGIDFLPERSNE